MFRRVFRLILPVLCFSILAANAFAQTAPTEGRILYVDTTEKGKTYLATINPDGTGKSRLTPSYSNIVFPRYCPKHKWIGFTNKLPDMSSEVFLLSGDNKKIKRIFGNANLEGFSPCGKYILYSTADRKAELYSYSLESKKATKLSENLRVTAADWSPKGNWIVVSAMSEDGSSDLWMISTMAQGFRRLTDTKGVSESFPVFTHDGKHVAFISNRHGSTYEIEYLDLAARKFQRPLLVGLYPSVSPDSKWVTYEMGNQVSIARSDGLHGKTVVEGRTPCWIK